MPRAGKIKRRVLLPDPIYHSRLVSRFINRVMKSGKKTVAQNLVYNALKEIEDKTNQDPVHTFERAITNVMPKMEVRPRRIGGASYQIPVEVRGDRKEALAIRWLIDAAKSKPNKEYRSFSEKLVAEILDASNNQGLAIKKKEDTLRTAEANRAFAHFKF